MARHDDPVAGCLGALLAPFILLFAFYVLVHSLVALARALVALPGIILAAPAAAAYLLVNGSAQTEQYRLGWLAGAGVAPLFALALVRLACPRTGWLRGGQRGSGTDASRRSGGRSRTRKRPVLTGYLARAGILLAASTTTALVTLLRGHYFQGPDTGPDQDVFGNAGLIATALLVAIGWWDRRPYPVSVETVRAATKQAERTLRRVQAENERVERLARQVEAKLAATLSEADFASLRNLHYESFTCADGAYDYYGSTQTSLRTMEQLLRNVRVTSLWWLGPVGRPVTARARRERAELEAAASTLAGTCGQLSGNVDHALSRVQALNARTNDMKQSIRDDCGVRGQRWYEELEARIEAARDERRSKAWAGR